MRISKERADAQAFLPVWVRNEHLARYQFAAKYVADKIVVDCACGDGTSSETFARAGAMRVHGFDVDAETVSRNGRNHPDPRLSFDVGDATHLPLPDKSADVYVSLETIEHVEADRALLTDVARVLRRDGLFICSTPNRYVSNPGKKIADKPCNPFHVREYDRQEFGSLLGDFFEELEWFGQNPKNPTLAGMMNGIGKIVPFHGAVRINQFGKLPRFLFDRLEHHRVVPEKNTVLEYMVVVCRKPRAIEQTRTSAELSRSQPM